MDGLKGRVPAVDSALQRFKHFDCEIEMGVPDVTGWLEAHHPHARNMNLSEEIDLGCREQTSRADGCPSTPRRRI